MTRDRDPGPVTTDSTEPSTAARKSADRTSSTTEARETTGVGKTNTQLSTSSDTSRWSPPPPPGWR